MKIICFIVFLSFCSNSPVGCQSTEDYFSVEGLSINAYHNNIYEGIYSKSYTYYRKSNYCNVSVLEFINNQDGHFRFLKIEEDKVYRFDTSDCQKELLYDFGVEIDYVIDEGIYTGWRVIDKSDVILENGETRKRINVVSPDNEVTSWINGIGDIVNSLFPVFPYQEYFEGYDRFVCAKVGDQLLWSNPSEVALCPTYSCVKPLIQVNYTVDNFTLHLDNQTIFGSSYLWDFGDGNFASEYSTIHEYNEPGCYTLHLKVSNECYGDSVIQQYNIPICIGDPWQPDYSNDTLSLKVYRFSDSLEFIYNASSMILYKTADGGTSWTQLFIPEPPPGVRRDIIGIKMFDHARGIMLCGHISAESDQKAILVTADGGITWEEKAEGSYYMLRGEVTPDGRGWAIGQWEYWRTFDFGQTWETIEYPGFFYINNVQFIHDSLLIGRSYTGLQPHGTYHLVKSRDNGLTWEKINVPVFVRDWVFFDQNNGYGYRENYGMSKTIDGGLTWQPVVLPFNVKAYAFYDVNSGWLTDDTELVHYTSDGMNNFTISNCGNHILRQLTPISSNTAFAVSGNITWGTVFTGRTKLLFDQSNSIDCFETDKDLDGFPASVDCDDQNASIHPGMIELQYNGIDDDCDSTTLDDDLDLDGFLAETDCDDENALINPAQHEIVYNSIDDDCDTTTADDDLDQDGFLLSEDCNDLLASVFPGAIEIPGNGIDEDCDGSDLITSTLDLNTLSLHVYPNPTSGRLYIRAKENQQLNAAIFDLTGKLLLSENAVRKIDLSHLADGLYILKCSDGSTGISTVKRIVLDK
jgi:photosystem II stability/assembly factor-like uncharacterized protein